MRVLVTGAAGFVGSWLVRDLLADGHSVFAASLDGRPAPHSAPGAEWVQLEITSEESVAAAMEAAQPQAVFHLAGQASVGDSFHDPLGTWDVNATGTLRVGCAMPRGARLLLVSSAEAYGVIPEHEQPISEDRPLRPTNPYAASKAAAEMAALQVGSRGAEVVIARSFNHTGPGQDVRFALPSFARQLAAIRAGEAQPLLRVGNLSARRDMLDVRDVVRAYVRLVEAGEPGGVYNVCSGRARSMAEAVDELVDLSGTRARVEVDTARVRPVDVPLLLGDNARLRALGWTPSIPFRQTLSDLLEWEARQLAAPAGGDRVTGTVYLVGAGPGDPGLLTLRAAELMDRADVLVYDALVSPAIMERAPRAERVYVGKREGEHSRTQEQINQTLVELARRHRTVVRLKGGDPFVFGRGGEEALVLLEAGIPFEVVPGVTAGIAAPAYAGIPVTQRGIAASVAFVTGHEDPTKPDTDVDWAHLARGVGTVVFYMGVGKMAENFRRLVEHGRAADTPAAAIEWGTYPRQRTVTGTLETLPAIAREAGIGAPSLIVVGEVVSLREQLAWWDRRPLSGRRIVVTRARAQASDFASALEALGAEVVQFPTIRIAPAPDEAPLLRAAAQVGTYDWIVFTSVNGVERFWYALARQKGDARALGGVRICAIGPATAAELERRGIVPDVVPDEFVAEAAVQALASADELRGRRILLPRADVARAVLPEQLRALGAEVVEVAAYTTVQDGADAERVRGLFQRGEVDAVTFTASSTVRNFVDLVGADTGGAKVASIGPITSGTARELGLAVDLEAAEYTIPGLVRAIRDFYAVGG